jgi:hypothetical protein
MYRMSKSIAKNNFNQVPPKKYKGTPQQVQEKRTNNISYQQVLSNRPC